MKKELDTVKVLAEKNYIKAYERSNLLNRIIEVLDDTFGMEFNEAAFFGGKGDIANTALHANFSEPFTSDKVTLVISWVKDNEDNSQWGNAGEIESLLEYMILDFQAKNNKVTYPDKVLTPDYLPLNLYKHLPKIAP